MKKTFQKYKLLFFCLLVVLFASLFGSCGIVRERQTEKTESKEVVKDTVVITKTLPVIDTLRVEVPVYRTVKPDCDSLVNTKVREELNRLSTKKESGKNSYGFYFDKYKNQLIAYANLKEQNSELHRQLNEKVKVVYKDIYKEVPKIYIPKIIKYLAWFGGLSLLCLFVFLLYKFKNFLPI